MKAISALEENSTVDLILMDIMMPVLDGYETMGRIREQERFKNLPILALTAKTGEGEMEKCIEAGANDFLPKPIVMDHLFSKMGTLLDK